MNTPLDTRFTRKYKIMNLGITTPPANDENGLIIDSRIPLSAAEKSALRSDFETLAPVIAINKKVFRLNPASSFLTE